jgi:hypothetical protein
MPRAVARAVNINLLPAAMMTAVAAPRGHTSVPTVLSSQQEVDAEEHVEVKAMTGAGATAAAEAATAQGGASHLAAAVAAGWQPGDPVPCGAWAAGFSFSRAEALMRDAPYPPHDALPHLFFGEWVPLVLQWILPGVGLKYQHVEL